MNYQNGVMPTNEWFEKIKAHVDFKGKSVVDYGCAEGVMCRLAKEAGASVVIGVDNQEHFQPSEGVQFVYGNIESKGILIKLDISIFSMIIHWIGKKKFLRLVCFLPKLIIVFREKNSGYQIPHNGKWFPTLKELTATLQGFRLKHSEVLMEQDNHKRIILAIYEKDRT